MSDPMEAMSVGALLEEPTDSQWAELVAGRAVEVAPPPIQPARRPIELESVSVPAQAPVADRLGGVVEHAQPGRAYRSMHKAVLTLVLSFFASGAGMCVYVLARG